MRHLARRVTKAALIVAVFTFAAVTFLGCTTDGEVRNINGDYRKVFPDKERGGYYYVDRGKKIHLDRLPEDDIQRELRNERQQKYYGPGPDDAVLPGW